MVHHQIPGGTGRRWTALGSGARRRRRPRSVIKNAKEQLRALPDALTYGLLRYLNPDTDLTGPDPSIGFNYLGRLGAGTAELSDELWRPSQDGLSVTGAATAMPMPLGHTVELNAATIDTETGPQLNATWIWAPSSVGPRPDQPPRPAVVRRLGRHLRPRRTRRRRTDPVRHRPCPTHPTADRRTPTALPHRRRPAADPAPTGAALPRQHRARISVICMRCNSTSPSPGRSTPTACAMRCKPWSTATPTWPPDSCDQYDQPMQIIPADPEMPWQYTAVGLRGADPSTVRAPSAPRSATSPTRRHSGWR